MTEFAHATLPIGLSAKFWTTYRPNGPIGNSLQHGEEWIGSWDGLGLYEGNNKIPSYQLLLFHLTTHRILLAPSPDPSSSTSSGPSSSSPSPTTNLPGLAAELRYVRQTEFYTGFMRSSAKITIHLGHPTTSSSTGGPSTVASSTSTGTATVANGQIAESGGIWTCNVCGFRNHGDNLKCELCGVGRDKSRDMIPSRPSTPARPKTLGGPIAGDDPGGRMPPSKGDDGKLACPACTFLNHPSLLSCEICGTTLPRQRKSGDLHGTAVTRSRGNSGIIDETGGGAYGASAPSPGMNRMDVVRLSFRRGGEKVAYAKLKSVLSQKAWEQQTGLSRKQTADPDDAGRAPTPRAGIDGILQSISLDAKSQSTALSSAFADLEVLMVRAGEMVKLAQSLNDKLSAQQRAGSSNPNGVGAREKEEEATLIRTSLVQLGLPAPALTSDMVRSDREYHAGLAEELGALLTGQGRGSAWNGSRQGARGVTEGQGLMVGTQGRGVIGLDEVWGLWMRARGVALLSPATLIAILPLLADHTSPPIRSHTLPSGLMVLFSPTYSISAVRARVLQLLDPDVFTPSSGTGAGEEDRRAEKSLSLLEIAAHEGLAIGLAKDLLQEIEQGDARNAYFASAAGGKGLEMGLVRDEQAEQASGGVRWYRDLITTWPLDR